MAGAVMVALVAGCATSYQMGKPPPVARLAELKPGVSTAQELESVLGAPQGRGATRMPNLPLQDVWLYESSQIEGSKARMRMLIVFVDREKGVYQGHMWFASGQLYGQTK
jgi:hypothetical protein